MSQSIFKENYFSPCQNLPNAIIEMKGRRDELNRCQQRTAIQGLNYSIILQTACLIEGHLDLFCRMAIKIFLLPREEQMTEFEKRLAKDLMNRIDNTAWSKYSDLFNLFFEKHSQKKKKHNNLKELYNRTEELKETWESVNNLFDLRNILAHGQSIGVDIDPNVFGKLDLDKKAEEVKKYLLGKGLIDLPTENDEVFYFDEILMNERVADFFFEKSKKFLLALARKATIGDRCWDFTLCLKVVSDVDELPSNVKKMVVVGKTNDGIHIRIFDAKGEIVVDAVEQELLIRTELDDLKNLLKDPSPPPINTMSEGEKEEIIEKATLVSGYTRQIMNYSIIHKMFLDA